MNGKKSNTMKKHTTFTIKNLATYAAIALVFILNSCTKSESGLSSAGGDATGQGGSLARFAIVDNTLYTVTNNRLLVFDITDREKPVLKGNTPNFPLGDIETIFARDNNTLFIGSSSAIYIYNISNKLNPVYRGQYNHATACDPVVANNTVAYATLRSSNGVNNWRCNRNVNQLLAIDITNLSSPFLIKTYNLKHPKGLGLYKSELFVCDENALIRYNANIPSALGIKAQYNLALNDVIIYDSLLIGIGNNGLVQYQIHKDSLEFLSNILTYAR